MYIVLSIERGTFTFLYFSANRVRKQLLHFLGPRWQLLKLEICPKAAESWKIHKKNMSRYLNQGPFLIRCRGGGHFKSFGKVFFLAAASNFSALKRFQVMALKELYLDSYALLTQITAWNVFYLFFVQFFLSFHAIFTQFLRSSYAILTQFLRSF